MWRRKVKGTYYGFLRFHDQKSLIKKKPLILYIKSMIN